MASGHLRDGDGRDDRLVGPLDLHGSDLLSIVTTREALRKVSLDVRWKLRPHGKES
jgi:hypothetical protein